MEGIVLFGEECLFFFCCGGVWCFVCGCLIGDVFELLVGGVLLV